MKLIVKTIVALVVLAAATTGFSAGQGRGSGGVIFVTSQGLYFDTFAAADMLPPVGPFQQLKMGPDGPYTEFGPGSPGYLGGRWWVDANGDGVMNDGDVFFLCPLLGPGRTTP